MLVSVCVCVCVRERERERVEGVQRRIHIFGMMPELCLQTQSPFSHRFPSRVCDHSLHLALSAWGLCCFQAVNKSDAGALFAILSAREKRGCAGVGIIGTATLISSSGRY